MRCPVSGLKCAEADCIQWLPKSYATQCKLQYLREKAIKFRDLATMINDIEVLTSMYNFASKEKK